MRQQTVSFHFSKPDPTPLLPPLDRLPGHGINGSSASDLVLVRDHVSQPLVMDDAKEYLCLHLYPTDSTVQSLCSIIVVSSLFQLSGKIVDGFIVWIFTESEGGGILTKSMDSSS